MVVTTQVAAAPRGVDDVHNGSRTDGDQPSCGPDARHGDTWLRAELLGVGAALTAGGLFHLRAGADLAPAVPAGRRAGDRRLARAGPRGGTHRLLRRPADVPDHLAGHRR